MVNIRCIEMSKSIVHDVQWKNNNNNTIYKGNSSCGLYTIHMLHCYGVAAMLYTITSLCIGEVCSLSVCVMYKHCVNRMKNSELLIQHKILARILRNKNEKLIYLVVFYRRTSASLIKNPIAEYIPVIFVRKRPLNQKCKKSTSESILIRFKPAY